MVKPQVYRLIRSVILLLFCALDRFLNKREPAHSINFCLFHNNVIIYFCYVQSVKPGLFFRPFVSGQLIDFGCFPLCQTDRSEISGNTEGKWNDIFRLNRVNQ